MEANTRSYTNVLIKRGALQRGPCERCSALQAPPTGEPIQAHHPDLRDPRRVQWLCRAHHLDLHAELRHQALQDELYGG